LNLTSIYNFESKIALVTGASRGIGKEICRELLSSNCRVIGTYGSNDKIADQCRQDFFEFGSNFLLKKNDVSSKTNAGSIFDYAYNIWGESVSFLVNNAGILEQGEFDLLSADAWDKTLSVNLRGPFLLSQSFIRQTPVNGAIVNISSVGGQVGGDKAPDYAASKAALISLTKSVARIGSKVGIRSNSVAPGWIETDIFTDSRLSDLKEEAKSVIPLKRMGRSSEVARAVLFLLSEDASYITGHCLNVNGGIYLG
jgi:NAD(P)-dependent dehydrogenase (short-subunit alcohol dehydrogenase family)